MCASCRSSKEQPLGHQMRVNTCATKVGLDECHRCMSPWTTRLPTHHPTNTKYQEIMSRSRRPQVPRATTHARPGHKYPTNHKYPMRPQIPTSSRVTDEDEVNLVVGERGLFEIEIEIWCSEIWMPRSCGTGCAAAHWTRWSRTEVLGV